MNIFCGQSNTTDYILSQEQDDRMSLGISCPIITLKEKEQRYHETQTNTCKMYGQPRGTSSAHGV